MKGKIILLFCLVLLVGTPLSFAYAEYTGFDYEIVKQGNCFNLTQLAQDSTYCNISSIVYPNMTKVIFSPHISMERDMWDYTYSTCDYSSELGYYHVNGYCDETDGYNHTWYNVYYVTKSGNMDPVYTQYIFLISVGSMIFLSLLFFFISGKFKDGKGENSALKFGFIGLSLIIGIIAIFFSYVSIGEFYSGFDKIMNSYYIFIYVTLAVLLIIFIFILINLIVKALDSFRIKKGLK